MFLPQERTRLLSKKINNLIFYNTVLKFNDFATVFYLKETDRVLIFAFSLKQNTTEI